MITAARWAEVERAGAEARRLLPWNLPTPPRTPHGLSLGEATAFEHGWRRADQELTDLARSGLLDRRPVWA